MPLKFGLSFFPLFCEHQSSFLSIRKFNLCMCCVHNSVLKINVLFVFQAQKLIKHQGDQEKDQFKEARQGVQGKKARGLLRKQ